MALNKGDKRIPLLLTALLIVSQIYFGSLASVAAEDAEHAYVLFQDDFEDGEAGDWMIDIPPEAPPGSDWAVELDDGNHILSVKGFVWAEAGDYTWTNYTLEATVKLLAPHGGHLNFRVNGPVGRYFLDFYSAGLILHKEYPAGTCSGEF